MDDYRPGRIAAVVWDSNAGPRDDLFVRGPRDTLVHWWDIDFGASGVEDLGGELRGDPVVVSRRTDRLDIFARGKGSVLLHWWWDANQGQIRGPETPRPGWRIGYDPVAVSPDEARADAYVQGVDNFARRIGTVENDWAVESTAIESNGPPCVLASRAGTEFLARGRDGQMVATGRFHVGRPPVVDRPGGGVAGRPDAQRWNSSRVDAFALDEMGTVNHWGWSGTEMLHMRQGRWFTDTGILPGRYQGDLVVNGRPNPDGTTDGTLMDLLVVTEDGILQSWHWDGTGGFMPYNFWQLTAVLGPVSSPISVQTDVSGRSNSVYAWGKPGELHEWNGGQHFTSTPEWPETSPLPEPVHIDLRPASHLLRRPADMVILGVDLDGLVPAGQGSVEVAGEGRVGVTFPPQHVGEETNHGDGPLHPSASEAGVPTWRSQLSGPSRLTFDLESGTDLTATGLLGATGALAADPADRSAVELPVHLYSHLTGAARAEHHADPWSRDGIVALWRTRIVAEAGARLGLTAVSYGEDEDDITLPLGWAARGMIVAQGTPAAVDRLELSALGGWLTAQGRWPSFDWDHQILQGRDWKVRTLQRGRVYPTGHRAEFVEYITRDVDLPGQDPIAVLRSYRVLNFTEPVRGRPEDAGLARAFPFDSVEITEAGLTGLDDPDGGDPGLAELGKWTQYLRKPIVPDELLAALDAARAELADLPPMPGDFAGSPPIVEDLADIGGTDLAEAQAALANRTLALLEEIDVLNDRIVALGLARDGNVPWYFVPHRGGAPVRVPMRCTGPCGPVTFDLPVVFVVDTDLPQTETMTAFDSLTHPQIDERLAQAFTSAGGGAVPLPGTRIDLLRSGGENKKIDIQVVRALNVFAAREGRGFRPRLGPPPGTEGWAVDVELVEMRQLLPANTAAHSAKLAFAREFESVGDAVPIPLVTAAGSVPIDFSQATDRAGGLISPVIEATGLSRGNGLVNAAGLRDLDPVQMVGRETKLLGVALHTLLGTVQSPPEITSDLAADGLATVTMAWTDVELTPGSDGPLVQIDDATKPVLNLRVVTGSTTETTCTLRNFALALPPKTALLKLIFEGVRFTQRANQPPEVTIEGKLTAEFLNELDLLQGLQDKFGLGDSLPEIRVTSKEIVARYSLPLPEVTTGAFVIRNAAFSVALTVPFQGDPVSVALGLASREKPFILTVLMFGGGGYMDVEFRGGELTRLEISLEFGAAVAVKFLIAQGEAHVLGGIRFQLIDGKANLSGFLRIGGSLEILGLVSVSVELVLELGYQTTGNRLVGRATLVLELDLTLWSDSVELDSGEWVISGEETTELRPVADIAEARPRASTDQLDSARSFRRAYR